MIRSILALAAALSIAGAADARSSDWITEFKAIAVQQGGRVMPLDTYARRLAVELTGRSHWRPGRGPEAFSGRHHVELLCDLLFMADAIEGERLIAVCNRHFKRQVGLEVGRDFFSAIELLESSAIHELVMAFEAARQNDPDYRANPEQRAALELTDLAQLVRGFRERPLRIVPSPDGPEFLDAGPGHAEAPAKQVSAALVEFGDAYREGGDLVAATKRLRGAMGEVARLDEAAARRVRLELFYNAHAPWTKSAIAFGIGIALFALSALGLRTWLRIAAWLFVAWGIAEQALGLYLRIAILGRPPVTNTYESLLWMSLVAIVIGVVAQAVQRRGWYVLAGLIAAEICTLFSMLVPLGAQTNALPPVLRSSFWLIMHVLVIVTGYGILALSAVLGHVYLVKEVLLARRGHEAKPLGNPIITQVYRTMQIGLVLLVLGTVLGGVWAADAWGRFWGWDPKETWALISIIVYFAMLHARYVGWLRDFGLATASIVGLIAVVWTFYGVNYVMASGLHTYGFGSGSCLWLPLWVVAEAAFLVACRLRRRAVSRVTESPGGDGSADA